MNQGSATVPAIPLRPGKNSQPLSFAQERLWFLDGLGAGSSYNIPIALKLTGRVELTALRDALNAVIARHDALRMAFPAPEDQPRVTVTRSQTLQLPVVNVDPGEALQAASAVVAEPFDLAQGPLVRANLFRLRSDEHWLVISIHHIVCDGWSVKNLISELAESYSEHLRGHTARLPNLLVQYGDYALWQRQHLTGESGNAERVFWRQELEGVPPALELPADRPRPVKPAGPSAIVSLEIPERLVTALAELSQDEGTTLFSTLLAGWQTLLHRWTGEVDFCVGTPVAGRTRPEFEPLIGLFVNTLVLRGELSGDPSFREVLQRCRETVLRAHEHQDMPFEQLVAELRPERELGRTPLVSTVIALQHLGGRLPTLAGLEVSPISLPSSGAKFDLTLELAQDEDERSLSGALEYRSDFFEHSTVERLADQFLRLLEGAAADPDRHLSRLPLLGRQERQRVLVDWNGGKSKSEVPITPIHEPFTQWARAAPGRVALVFGDQRMTYGELDAKAERVASQLLALEIGPETRVGLCLPRSADLIVAILAVWKAGGAYVPLDPDYPAERLLFLLSDCGAKVVLTQRQLLDRLPPTDARVLCFEDMHVEDALQQKPAVHGCGLAGPSNAAYVIYTSGSTGNPKGVVVEHRHVARLFIAAQEQFCFDENDVWTLFHSFAFDFSIWEIWGALLYGGRLVVVPWWVSRSPEAFLELAERERVTVLNQTPSAFRQLMTVALQQRKLPASLRTVIFGGEALNVPSLSPWFDMFGDERPELVNMYGITETTVHVTLRRLRREDAQAGNGSVIGRPLPHLSVYVLDANGQPVPIGVRGELYVGGESVARGYLNRAELTAQRFLENPFGEGKIYRSGDLGRWLASGELEYLGRADNQVKVRGFRIELGEIEAALRTYQNVREAIVLARQNGGIEPRLIAYVVLGDVVTWAELRAFLAARLPDHMLPAAMVELESLPLTAHGKLDRSALPTPDHRAASIPFAEPETDVEQLLAEVWQEVLGINRVGRNDNFFHLGGDSLRSIEVRARARKHGLDVPLQEIFRRQTLHELAAVAGRSPDALQPLAPFALVDSQDRSRLPSDAENAYPLSHLQAGLHYHSEARAGYTVYLNSLRIRCRFDFAALREAVDAMTARHPILRTSFDFSFQDPLQIVHKRAETAITVDDIRDLAHDEDQETRIARWLDAELHHRFEWNQSPLFRFHVHVRNDGEFQLTMSDACLDGWSVGTLLTELLAYYFARVDRKSPPELPELPFGYSDFIALEREAIANEESQKFWDGLLAHADFAPLLKQPAHEDKEPHRVRRIDLPIPDDVAAGLKALADSLDVSIKHVLLAAHLKALGHLTGSISPVTGLLANGRPEVDGGERIVAPFVNLVPFCLNLSAGTFADLGRRAFIAESELLPHRRYPMAELKKRYGGQDLFDTVFNFTHFHIYRRLRALSGDVLDATGNENTYFPLTVQANMNENTGALGLAFDYQTCNFATEWVRKITAVYERVLGIMARWPGHAHDLQGKLPEYMAPASFAELPALPRMNHGKVDRKALPMPGSKRPNSGKPFTPPATELEERLAAIWQEILGLDRVSRDDDFFHLGGDSLSATRLIARVRYRLKIELPLQALFEGRTLCGVAERVQVAEPQRVELEAPTLRQTGLLPLSFAQRRLWFLEQIGASAAYHIPIAIRFEGTLDHGALAHALNEVAHRHETLRATFELRNGEPVQVVHPGDFALTDCDLRTGADGLAHLLAEDARIPFDITRGPLWRAKLFQLDQEDHVLAVTFHHIIADGWSLDIFLRELAALYRAFHQGTASPLLPLQAQYSDFAIWQHQHLQLDSQLAFWKCELSGLERCDLAADRPRPALPSYRGARVPVSLDAALVSELRALSHNHGATLFMTLLAAWQVLLHRLGAGDDIAVGTPIAGRQREELEPLIGFFVNTLVLRTDLSADPTFADLLIQVQRRTLGAYANQDAPFERVVEEIAANRDTSRHPLFQTMLALASTPRSAADFAGLRASFLEIDPGACKFDVAISLAEDDASIAGMIEYSTDLFDPETIVRLRDRFERLLRAAASGPERRVSELPLMSAEEQDMLRCFLDGGHAAPDEPRCVHLLFHDQAKKNPNATAVVAGAARISYGELKRCADQVAARLAASGIGPGARVAFRANRSTETVAAILGTLSAGAAYVPLDSGWPEARVAAIVAEAGATYVNPAELLAGDETHQVQMEPTLDDLAYILYTSGSSGRAKGVAVTHRNLAHSTGARPVVYGERVESFLLASPFSFDSSVAGLFWTLCEAGTLIIPPDDFLEDLPALAQTLAAEHVTHWLSIPSLYAALLRHGNISSSSLRTVIVAGEACPPELVTQHRALLPEVRLFNEYGPTEATVWCTAGKLTDAIVHIGRPIPGAHVEVVDRHLKLIPIGVPGEILISGAGVAAGYIGQPETTTERFVVRDGVRCYCSGDLGRFRSDGSLELLGRLDDQVKIRGVRVEPAEIEAVLASHPGVSAAAVVAVEGNLVAHVCAAQPSEDELRRFLVARLPEALVPRTWAFHRELPKTTSGKIDRRALIANGFTRSAAAVAPRDETERELLSLFEQLLSIRPIGISDGFFQLGGHSLLAVELMARIEKQFRRQLPLEAIFQGDTVADLAAMLREPSPMQSSPLILLERGGECTPFFFVHPVGGTILQYRTLARRLGKERPFYALQSPALEGNPLSSDITIEALAQSYLDAVQRAFPKGPYLLGGWSFGGLVAIEIARALRHAGEEVALVALLDSHAQSDPYADPNELAALAAWELGDGQSWPHRHFATIERIVHAHLRAVRRWSPKPYDGRALLFAAHQRGVVRDATLGWGPLLPQLSVIEVEADHFSLLREPAVDEVARKIYAALAGRL
ncbi:MAG: amino acid adenylation domain-containing protein [Terriglobales bacterium]